MNIGDYVYIYLFDLEKSLQHMNKLRTLTYYNTDKDTTT